MQLKINPQKISYQPLEEITISGLPAGNVTILDGNGDAYFKTSTNADGSIVFRVGGSLGTHTIIAKDQSSQISSTAFRVDAKTTLKDSKNLYAPLLRDLYVTMVHSCGGDGAQLIEVNNKLYFYFIRWLRDHTHTMKGMKYFYKDVKSGLELYSDTQRHDGMIYDRICPRESDAQGWRDYTFKKGDFATIVYSNADKTGVPYTLQRIPVENDVEFLFLECLYYTWKATGDTDWMKQHLDAAMKAVKYSSSDPYRWSEKFKLLKRGYTIDTWDFMHDDDCALTLGDNVCDIDKTSFGVMFGDCTGMAVGCRYLAEMLRTAERDSEAGKYEEIADKLFSQLEKISWNGEFYTHHVSEDPSFKRNVGNTDESSQVTLSNAYSINRQIGAEKARAIVKTYQRIRKEMPKNSPGEFYNCYPPFENGFGKQDGIWQYMNGGVSSIVAGELARGAFCFGEEEYGLDILNRMKALAERHDGHLHVCFNGNPQTDPPTRSFSSIDFANFANLTPEYSESAGWGDPGNDLSRLPRGKQTFAHIPFDIGDKGIGLATDKDGYAEEITLPVNARQQSLYLLHTMNGGGLAAEMIINYSDGSRKTVYLQNGKQMDNWFMPNSDEIRAACHAPKLPQGWPPYQLVWQGENDTFENVGVFLWGWDNPMPEKEIKDITFKAPDKNGEYFLIAVTGSDHPVWFPQSDLSFGIPDGWGAAAVVYALFEGLAGVVDTGVAFDKVEVSPRWDYTDEDSVDMLIKYEASGGYTAYSWRKNKAGTNLLLSSSAHETVVRMPLRNSQNPDISVNGEEVDYDTETVGDSKYAKFAVSGKGVYEIEIK